MNEEIKMKPGFYWPNWTAWLLISIFFFGCIFFAVLWLTTCIELEGSKYDCYESMQDVWVERDFYKMDYDRHQWFKELMQDTAKTYRDISMYETYKFIAIANGLTGAEPEKMTAILMETLGIESESETEEVPDE